MAGRFIGIVGGNIEIRMLDGITHAFEDEDEAVESLAKDMAEYEEYTLLESSSVAFPDEAGRSDFNMEKFMDRVQARVDELLRAKPIKKTDSTLIEEIDRLAEAGLCQFSSMGKHAFLQDIRRLIARPRPDGLANKVGAIARYHSDRAYQAAGDSKKSVRDRAAFHEQARDVLYTACRALEAKLPLEEDDATR